MQGYRGLRLRHLPLKSKVQSPIQSDLPANLLAMRLELEYCSFAIGNAPSAFLRASL